MMADMPDDAAAADDPAADAEAADAQEAAGELQAKARRHLWLHFARMGAYSTTEGPASEIPIFVRGEGVHLFDDHGRRYLDGLSGLFTVQVGHGRADIAAAAARQAEQLAYYPIWSAAHPAAIELAA